jgi:hypothetical protein
MTDARRVPRASKRLLRAWAWLAGALAFLAPAAVLGAAPRPPETGADAGQRPTLVIRRVTRRIVITRPSAPAPVRYISGGSASSGSGSVSSPPAATSTGGS